METRSFRPFGGNPTRLKLVRCLSYGASYGGLDRVGLGDAAVRGEGEGELLPPLGEEGLRVPGERRRVGVVEVERLDPYRVGRGAVQCDLQPSTVGTQEVHPAGLGAGQQTAGDGHERKRVPLELEPA
jgi:hypothetical protein